MRIVLVHDYLTQYGGAERVLEVLHATYPDSDVFTSLYRPDQLPAAFRSWSIKTSPLDRLPGGSRTHRLWLPFYPAIFGLLGRSIKNADLVIADSSAWSHHAFPGRDIPLVCYCHSPARFLYGDRHNLGTGKGFRRLSPLVAIAFRGLRWLDRRAAKRVTRYIANSSTVSERVARMYGITAPVVYPPVDVARFRPVHHRPAEAWFLVVSRLVPHKWVDRAVRASTVTGFRLKVIGEGRAMAGLERIAGPSVEFLGARGDGEVVDHMQRCRAFILPGVEDFGMTAVEAQAAGRPVIAANGGGALETVLNGVTGLFFDPGDETSLPHAMRTILARSWDSEAIMANAARFDSERFIAEMARQISLAIATRGDQEAGEFSAARP